MNAEKYIYANLSIIMENLISLIPDDIFSRLFLAEDSEINIDKYCRALSGLLNGSHAKSTVSDADLCDIYLDAILTLLDLHDAENAERFRRYLAFFDEFADDWCEFTKTNIVRYDNVVDALMDSLFYRIVYIYRNGLLLSSAASLHFGAVLSEDCSVARRLLRTKKTLRLCSLGGGSASDIVGVVSVLGKVAEDLDIRVTVVDVDGRWKNACLAVLRCMRQFRWATWKIDFIQSDLSERNLNSEARRAIKNADVVTMVSFLSEFEPMHLQRTLKNITELISHGSMLFVLDCADSDLIRSCGGRTGHLDNYQLIYEDICYLHTLKLDAVEKTILHHQKNFSALQRNCQLDVFVRIWMRTDANRDRISERQLQMNHRRNLDQFNLKETFLDRRFFRNWMRQFSAEMKPMGWSVWGIWRVVMEMERNAAVYQSYLVLSKMEMDTYTEKLECSESGDGARVRKIIGIFTEKEWEEYFEKKSDFALWKEELYRLSILSLYNHITRTMNFSWN